MTSMSSVPAALTADLQRCYQALADSPLADHADSLQARVEHAVFEKPHGKRPEWFAALDALPQVNNITPDFTDSQVALKADEPLSEAQLETLRTSLETFIPWRKGPFNHFGIDIDTEWRSDWKWQRVLPHLSPLAGRQVLDVGCGSGYHLWRMLGEDAKRVIGIDPSLFFLMQFFTVKHYVPDAPVHFLPLRSEDLPDLTKSGNSPTEDGGFDTVFSMGVLYHRRSPLQHLQELKGVMRAGGELVLETLVVAGDVHTALMPEDRYGKMRNVWFIPSTAMLELWLRRLGFINIRTVEVTVTSVEEQRSTDWMRFDSLATFLDPDNSALTVEGYPAPTRAVLIADLPA